MLVLGIDPGLEGALALIDAGVSSLVVYRMPIFSKTTTKTKKFIDVGEVFNILKNHKIDYAFMEQVAASPQMGVVSAFSFGEGYGKVQGVLAALKTPLTLVPPQTWKKALAVPKDKKEAVARANQLFPGAGFKKDGEAEASLIAFHGLLSMGYSPKGKITRVV